MSSYVVYLDKAVEVDWYCRVGDDYSPLIVVKDALDQVVDLTGYQSVKMQWRKDKKKGSVVQEFSVGDGFTVSAEGILWQFSPTTAGQFYHDLELTDSNGDVKTIMFGKIFSEQDTTHE